MFTEMEMPGGGTGLTDSGRIMSSVLTTLNLTFPLSTDG